MVDDEYRRDAKLPIRESKERDARTRIKKQKPRANILEQRDAPQSHCHCHCHRCTRAGLHRHTEPAEPQATLPRTGYLFFIAVTNLRVKCAWKGERGGAPTM
jgi:hypothetical protein